MDRKGYNSISCIPKEIQDKLNLGLIESATLAEWLSVNQPLLLKNVLEENDRIKYIDEIDKYVDLKSSSIAQKRNIGKFLYDQSIIHSDNEIFNILSCHVSDSVRCWAIYFALSEDNLDINEVLLRIRRFASDSHFNVRELAWLSARDFIINDLHESISMLSSWVMDADENIRRFASEVTRPVGVWCRHIPQLKENPVIGLPIIEPLKSDISRYVQNSVANWLNDVSKTNPSFVIDTTDRWYEESKTKETEYIIKRATRTIRKSIQHLKH